MTKDEEIQELKRIILELKAELSTLKAQVSNKP